MPSGISPTSFPSASPAAPKPTGFGGGVDRAVERGQGIGVRSARPVSSTGFRMRPFEPRGVRQRKYVELIASKPLTFGLGAAGTGKTYLAVAMAVRMLREGRVKKLILCRPAVEAGEKLGFLPGTYEAKINPYLRPLYDALFDLVEPAQIRKFSENDVIEVAPLAYMRGRTLADSFIILDEAQNTT
ncbi:MAG: PhoH family protein, partial [Planctomycetaceae bacterium]|nr:PhoH family protein [Planctomycetaceae bacterium]